MTHVKKGILVLTVAALTSAISFGAMASTDGTSYTARAFAEPVLLGPIDTPSRGVARLPAP